MSEQVLHIKELDLNIIAPSYEKMYDKDQGGPKLVVIGKPGTGKTTVARIMADIYKSVGAISTDCTPFKKASYIAIAATTSSIVSGTITPRGSTW